MMFALAVVAFAAFGVFMCVLIAVCALSCAIRSSQISRMEERD